MKCRDLYHLLLCTLADWSSLTHYSLTNIAKLFNLNLIVDDVAEVT